MPAKKATGPAHSYLEMIAKAILELKARNGASRISLKRWILSNYKDINYASFDAAFRRALKAGVEAGVLLQNKQSFKLAPEAKKKFAKKKKAPKEKKEKKEGEEKKKKKTKKVKKAKGEKKEVSACAFSNFPPFIPLLPAHSFCMHASRAVFL